MRQLSTIEMLNYNAGSRAKEIAQDACAVVIAGEGIYYIGGAIGWWNPVGWVCDALAVVSAACGLWTIGDAIVNGI